MLFSYTIADYRSFILLHTFIILPEIGSMPRSGLCFSTTPITYGSKSGFQKAFWKLESKLSEENKELAAATLRSIALNYVKQKGPTPPKSMLRAIGQLKKNKDIIITRPDKGSGVVLMDKSEYVRLLKEASIGDETKFVHIILKRPNTKGRPPKHYHPLLQKEKESASIVRKILPKPIADSLVLKGSRLAHLYGLQKTHKKKLAAMRPILSATGTYN